MAHGAPLTRTSVPPPAPVLVRIAATSASIGSPSSEEPPNVGAPSRRPPLTVVWVVALTAGAGTPTTADTRMERPVKGAIAPITSSLPRTVTRATALAQERPVRSPGLPLSVPLVLTVEEIPVALLARNALRSGPPLGAPSAVLTGPLSGDSTPPALLKKPRAL